MEKKPNFDPNRTGDGEGPGRIPPTIGEEAAAYRSAHPEAPNDCFVLGLSANFGCFICGVPFDSNYHGLKIDDIKPCAGIFCFCSRNCQRIFGQDYRSAGRKAKRLKPNQLRKYFDEERQKCCVGFVEGRVVEGHLRLAQYGSSAGLAHSESDN